MPIIEKIVANLAINDPEHFWIYVAGVPFLYILLKNFLSLFGGVLLVPKEERSNLWYILCTYLVFAVLKGFLLVSYYVRNQTPTITVTSFYASVDILFTYIPLAVISSLIILYKKPACCIYITHRYRLFSQIIIGIAAGLLLLVITGLLNVYVMPVPKFIFFQFVLLKMSWLTILAFVLVTPFVEETLFRGFIFNSMRKKWSPSFSCIVSAFIFAVYHSYLNANILLQMFLFGIAMALLMVRYKNLLICIFAHATFNLCLLYLNW